MMSLQMRGVTSGSSLPTGAAQPETPLEAAPHQQPAQTLKAARRPGSGKENRGQAPSAQQVQPAATPLPAPGMQPQSNIVTSWGTKTTPAGAPLAKPSSQPSTAEGSGKRAAASTSRSAATAAGAADGKPRGPHATGSGHAAPIGARGEPPDRKRTTLRGAVQAGLGGAQRAHGRGAPLGDGPAQPAKRLLHAGKHHVHGRATRVELVASPASWPAPSDVVLRKVSSSIQQYSLHCMAAICGSRGSKLGFSSELRFTYFVVPSVEAFLGDAQHNLAKACQL